MNGTRHGLVFPTSISIGRKRHRARCNSCRMPCRAPAKVSRLDMDHWIHVGVGDSVAKGLPGSSFGRRGHHCGDPRSEGRICCCHPPRLLFRGRPAEDNEKSSVPWHGLASTSATGRDVEIESKLPSPFATNMARSGAKLQVLDRVVMINSTNCNNGAMT